MISLNEMSNDLTNIITKDLDYNDDKKEIVAYAIETSLHSVIGVLLLILFALLVGAVKTALIAAVFGVILRRFSGGAHFDTPTKCLIFGAILYSGLGVLTQKLVEYRVVTDLMLWACLGVALIIVSILAPVDSANKPIHSAKLKRNLKGLSIAFVIVSFVIVLISSNAMLNVSLSLGILYQSLTLLPLFNHGGGG
ncbi:protein possibly involved in post-translational modification of quorum-sensing peptides [Desulfitobacterium dichloroeliminans LMG P-21439]|uniref:Protein possibly involved in post-translational modification of quorum-sensing peptides n=1 Tax=Desulfitobacterium dichloroeliminans (strain LMG P-21439 / DCA1) TaxID=871963 RepID=L0F2X9_DESDL|nr:accessory gene regulator B family protein [Desulfitobacterium dichloroeliminans]AGA68199.1 protein possibly involved in post-translational modification of quorum-sensing peptides [Desulfitobacterium dichloroeliminans LMG P-21439]